MARSNIFEEQVLDGDFISPSELESLSTNKPSYIELTYSQGKVSQVSEWVDSSKSKHVSETYYYYNNGKVNLLVTDVYDYDTGNVLVATISGVINRQNGKVSSMSYNRTDYVEV